MSELKRHYKLYKSGSKWVAAAIVSAGAVVLSGNATQSVAADTTTPSQSSATSGAVKTDASSTSSGNAGKTDTTESSTKKGDVTSNIQQNTAIKTPSNLTGTDKNGIQTNWSRDKSADTGNSDSNSVSNEAGKYWPNTQGNSLKDYSKTTITDFTKDQTFDSGYNPTPVLRNMSDLSLYIRGQKVDLSNLVDDDSLNDQYTGHNSKGHSRLISTSDLGENTYFWAKNVFKIYNGITHKYDRYDLKWTLESVNYGDANTQIALGIKGSQDGGGTQLLNIGSGWQLAHLGNFFNTHLQFFKEEKESASDENPALAIANADVTAKAVSIHMGFSDIDANEAVQLTSGVIKKVYVDSATQLAYQDYDGYLSVTRKYNDSRDVRINESKVTFLMEMDVPVEGFDLSVATIGNQKDSSNNYIHAQGSKVAPSLLSTMKYTEPLVIAYNKLDCNGKTTTESLQPTKTFEGLIGDKYTVDSTGNKVDTSAPSTITDSDGNIWKLVSEKTQGNPNGSYVDGTNEIDYYYQIFESKTIKETIHYVYKDGTKALDDYVAKPVTFTRKVSTDAVTGKKTYGSWSAKQSFAAVTSPTIKGYTPDKAEIEAQTVSGDDNDVVKTVTYKANTQKLKVVFIDDTTGQTLETINKVGQSDESANYDTKSDISKYLAQHYDLVSDDTNSSNLVFDHDDNTDQVYNVHLTHHTHQINDQTTKSEVIHYVYADGLARTGKAADDYHAKDLVFTRDGYHDEVTNEDHWNAWTPAQQEFTLVHSPKIQGFTPDIQTVDQTTVTPSSQNIEQTITYYGDVQLGHVKYIDDSDNGRVMSSDDLSGHTGETASYTTAKNIKNYTNQGYVFVSDNYPATGVVFDNNDLVAQDFEVHFKHGTITVTPEQPGKPGEPINPGDPDGSKYPNGTDAKSLQIDVSRTIDYVYQNSQQAQVSVNDSLHFIETKVIDKVTGKVLSDTWSPAQDFETKITPTIDGYTPDRQAVSNTGINHDHPAIHEVVTYNPDAQNAVVKYIDDTDQKQLSAEDLTGHSDEDSGYNTKSSIDKYLAGHYVLVSDDTHGQNVIYDHNDNTNQVYEVHFKHGTEPASESRTKNLTVHYVYAAGLARSGKASDDQKAQSLTFKRTGTKDLVTNNIAWNAWDHSGQIFDEIKSPAIDGYTPDQTSIKDVQVDADGLKLTEKTVVYNADSQKLMVNFIDDVTGKTLETINKVGQSDESANYDTKSDISKYLAQHYDLVSDDTNSSNLVFDHDDNTDQVYNVHLTHHTHQINDQTTKSEVIHYVYADGLARTGHAADDYHASDLVFTRDGYHDEVTNEDHWNAWTPAQQEFASVKSSEIQGYTADQTEIPVIKVNSASDNIKRTVTYNADKQKLDVVFIDDTTGKVLSTVTKEGLSDESVNYNTKDDINHYKSLHYNVVSDGTQGQNLVFDNDDGKDQHYEVHLVHATHPISESTSTKQTIHYQLADGTKVFDDYTAQVDFSRDGYNDEVTNEDHWNTWSPSDIQTFSKVASPVKLGYIPDKSNVAAVDVHPGDKDIEETVIYSPDKQVMTINYIDDVTGETLSTKQIIGVSDASVNYNTKSSINSYVADHYKLVSDDTNGDNLVFDHDDSIDQVYNVHLTHTYQKVDDHKSVNETVHYVYDNGQTARPDYKAPAINFSRTGTKDLVTSNIVWNAWTPAEQSFDQVTTPAISGYTPDVEVVPSVNVSHGSDDVERTVIYHADDQTILVNYIDDDTHSTLKTDTVIGKTAQKSNYTTKKSIDGYIDDHYELVSDETNDNELVFDSDSTKSQVYNVHLKHVHQNVSDSALVNETIHYIYVDGSKAREDYHAPVISFNRTGDKDLVTNAIVWNAWIPASQDFNAVESPVIDGYTPSQKTISNITVKPGDKDIDQTVIYAPDTQSIVVNYIDDVTGKTLKTDTLTGKSDRASDYTTKNNINGYENQHYVLVSDDTQGKTLIFDHDDKATQVYNVHLSHQTEPASQSRIVHETINYVYADGSKAADTVTAKPLIFTQTGVKDLVTGNIDWNGTWTSKQTFAEVKSPEITGYTASRTSVDPITVDHNSSDIYQTVIYVANDQTAKIKYIDDVTGKTLETDSANGKFGDQINFGHDVDMQIKAFEGQGYKVKSNSFNGQKYQADNSQNEFDVHFAHGTQNVSQTNKVMETVKYQFADGRQAQKDHVQTVEFTQHGVQDLVTKTTVWAPSDPQTFASVDTPKIIGYTADIQNVPAVTVNFGDGDITKVVTYKANDQLAGIKYIDDTTGKILDTEAASGNFGTKIEFMTDPLSMIQKFEDQGYKVKSNSFNGQKYQADNSQNEFEVHFTHGTQNVSRTNKVTETVKYQFADGRQAQKDYVQTAKFTQHGVQDLVTKTTVWTSSDPQTFVSVDTPKIIGYTADIQNVPAVTVNFGDEDIIKVVTYKANDQLAGIKYIDDTTGKTLDTEAASGKFGTRIEFMRDPSSMIQKFEGQGYKFKSNSFNGQKYQADNSKNQFEVHFTHGTQNVSRTNKVMETVKYQFADGRQAQKDYVQTAKFTQHGVQDLVTKTTVWTSSDPQTFVSVDTPHITGYTADVQNVPVATVNFGDADITKVVTYAKNAPTITTESKTIKETIHYVYKDGTKAHDDYVAKPVEFTREVSTDAVTGEKTYGSWSADPSFAAVTSPAIKGYTPDKAEIGSQTVSGDDSDLVFTVVYAKNDPTITTESKTIKETIHYVYKDGTKAHDDYVAKPVEFTREVSTDAVTGEKTYGSWSADPSFAAVTSPAIKGYTPDKAEIGSQTVNGDDSDLVFTVVYAKNDPTITTESKTINEIIHYVYKDGTKAHDDYVAKPVEFTREVSTDAVTGEKTYGSWSADPSFAAVTSPAIKGYTPDKAEIGSQTVSGDDSDLVFTVVYTKDAPTKPVNPSQPTTPAKPVNPSQPTTPAKPVNPSQPTTPTKPVQAGQAAATNFVNQRLPQTGETDQQHMTLSGVLLLAMSSLLGLFGMTKRQRKE